MTPYNARVHEVLSSDTLILHLTFFLPLLLSFFFTVTKKFILTGFTVIPLISY